MKKLRQSRVEPVLGTLINFLALRRINTRGQASAHKGMLLSAMAFNLRKLLRWNRKTDLAAVKALQGPLPLLFLASVLPASPFPSADRHLEKKQGSSFEAVLYSRCVVQQRPLSGNACSGFCFYEKVYRQRRTSVQ